MRTTTTIQKPETITLVHCDVCGESIHPGTEVCSRHACDVCGRDICSKCGIWDPAGYDDYPDFFCRSCYSLCILPYQKEKSALEEKYEAERSALYEKYEKIALEAIKKEQK